MLFTSQEAWQKWGQRPNQGFGRYTALEDMLVGRIIDLADVHPYLDGW
ncbi:hypothetical protein [Marinimicrobium sp. ARAG 43.8]